MTDVPKMANPGPLGLAGFGLTTVVLSSINAGLLPPEAVPVVVPLAFAYGGVAQLIAGVLEFRPATPSGWSPSPPTACSGGGSPCCNWTIGAGWLKAPPASAVGVTLFMWGVFTLLLWIVSFPRQQGSLEHLPAALDHLLPARRRSFRTTGHSFTSAATWVSSPASMPSSSPSSRFSMLPQAASLCRSAIPSCTTER